MGVGITSAPQARESAEAEKAQQPPQSGLVAVVVVGVGVLGQCRGGCCGSARRGRVGNARPAEQQRSGRSSDRNGFTHEIP